MNAGTLTDTAVNDSFPNLTGTLIGTDVDSGETGALTYAVLDATSHTVITVAGHYGSLTVNANGTYSYVADATAINALHAGTYADTFAQDDGGWRFTERRFGIGRSGLLDQHLTLDPTSAPGGPS